MYVCMMLAGYKILLLILIVYVQCEPTFTLLRTKFRGERATYKHSICQLSNLTFHDTCKLPLANDMFQFIIMLVHTIPCGFVEDNYQTKRLLNTQLMFALSTWLCMYVSERPLLNYICMYVRCICFNIRLILRSYYTLRL